MSDKKVLINTHIANIKCSKYL